MMILLLSFSTFILSAQESASRAIKWIEMEEAVNKNYSEPRKLFVYIYSDNCGWCKRMNDISFSDTVISNYINNHFYPVRLNSSISRNVTIGNRTFRYVPADPAKNIPSHHELVVTLLKGRLAFPAVAFINKKWNI